MSTPQTRAGPQDVPAAEATSYYGRPVIKPPVWKTPDVPAYLFLGGLAGASALLAEGAAASRRPGLERSARLAAASGSALGAAALVHDLGRPERFLNMLRVFRPTSPLSVGSWVLAPFSGLSAVAAAAMLSDRWPWLRRTAGLGAALLGPVMTTYTAALLADTAVPAWHEAHRELPFVFAGSAASAAGGLAVLLSPPAESSPATRLATVGTVGELVAWKLLERRLGFVGAAYQRGRAGRLLRAATALSYLGLVVTAVPGRSALPAKISGAASVVAGVLTRFGIFEAGMASARDPAYTVAPQRARAVLPSR